MNKLNTIKAIAIVILASLLFSACGTETASLPPKKEYSQLDIVLEEMAKLMAIVFEDINLRKAFKTAIDERFDGDTNVLYKDFADQLINDSLSLEQHLAFASLSSDVSSSLNTDSSAFNEALNDIQGMVSIIPRFQIALRGNIEEWDPETYMPLVTYAPTSINDLEVQTINAYDARGDVHTLNGSETPDVPVIVVGVNERTDDDGNLLPVFIQDKDGEFTQLQPDGSRGTSDDSVQACGSMEIMKQLSMRDDSEGWLMGGPELRLQVNGSKNPDTTLYNGAFNGVKTGRWMNFNRNLFRWCPSQVGDFLVFFWYEEDTGDFGTVSISYKGVGYSFNIRNGDDKIGIVSVNFDDLSNTMYDTGNVAWYETWK